MGTRSETKEGVGFQRHENFFVRSSSGAEKDPRHSITLVRIKLSWTSHRAEWINSENDENAEEQRRIRIGKRSAGNNFRE